MTDEESAMLTVALGTAMASRLMLAGILGRMEAKGLLDSGELGFVTDEVLRLLETMRGAADPLTMRAIDSARTLLTIQLLPPE